jgi:hypothetical protein
MAEISAGLVGLFLVGIFFYVETGFRRAARSRAAVEPYFRAATAIVLIVFAIPIFLSLTLVTLELVWSRVLFTLLSLLLLAVNVETVLRVRDVAKVRVSTLMVVNEAVSTAATVPLLVVPWALGGLEPSREDLTWSILLSFALGFLSIGTLVLSTFDISRMEAEGATSENEAP